MFSAVTDRPGKKGKRMGRSMHILMYRWKAYNYRDIEQTFLLLGYTVDNIEQELGSYDVSPEFERVIEEKIRGTHYDMVFTVNYFPLISNVCERTGVKYVSWTCDNPLISMYHESVFHDCNYIFTFDKTNYLEFRGMGVKHIWYLPLAVDTERMDALLGAPEEVRTAGAAHEGMKTAGTVPEEIGTAESVPAEIGKAGRRKAAQDSEMRKYRGDVAFVGSLYERNSYDKIKNRLPEYLRGYFDAVMEAQLNISGANIVEPMLTTNILEQLQEYFQLEKSEGSFSDLGLIFQTTVLGFKIAEIERRRALIELSKHYKVNVYSNSDVSDLLRIQYCGSVDYWSEMPKVFRMSKINLNFTIPNIKSGIPLRIWDVLGCGGFLLTNYQAEIPYYFKEGEDLVCFDSLEDLCEKVGYYLEHEEERKRIAWNGYRKVREKHSYIERIRTILDTVACEDAK
jgi:spore maturation protein CgeB